MDGKAIARIGAVAFVALASVATAIEMNRHDDPQGNVPVQAQPIPERDPLDAELARCSSIGEAGPRDPSCLKAWAQARRRFLGQREPVGPSASSAPTTLFPNTPASAGSAAKVTQPESSRPLASPDEGAR
ncbi:putative entry exclusion protein TrbK-alt [Sphingobium sp. LMA1-1-1.1]|uniref:putative entry exclusion protein TrbK-alt n=1 Tax=Sphingobium sp. LMA1-1-1.1 TaxID=3135238 RepID=UPI0034467A6B